MIIIIFYHFIWIFLIKFHDLSESKLKIPSGNKLYSFYTFHIIIIIIIIIIIVCFLFEIRVKSEGIYSYANPWVLKSFSCRDALSGIDS